MRWRGALLGLTQILSWGGSFFLLAVIGGPVARDTGWALQAVYGGLSIGIFISGLLAPRVGLLIQKTGGRRMLCASGLVIAFGLLILAVSPHVLVFCLGWVVIGIGMAAGLYDALFAAVGQAYPGRARSAITSITLVSGFCTTLVWPVLGILVDEVGWRYSCAIYAAILVATIWPLYARSLPAALVAAPASRPAGRKASSLDPATYRLVSLVFTLAAVLMTAISLQLLSLLQVSGYSLAAALGLSTLLGPAQVVSRIVDLAAGKRHPAWTTLISNGLVAVGLLAIAVVPALAAVGIVCYGAGNGLRAIVRGTLPLSLVPSDEYAHLMGRLARPALLGQAITPVATGFVMEHWGSQATMWLLCLLAVVNVLLTVRLLKLAR